MKRIVSSVCFISTVIGFTIYLLYFLFKAFHVLPGFNGLVDRLLSNSPVVYGLIVVYVALLLYHMLTSSLPNPMMSFWRGYRRDKHGDE